MAEPLLPHAEDADREALADTDAAPSGTDAGTDAGRAGDSGASGTDGDAALDPGGRDAAFRTPAPGDRLSADELETDLEDE